MRDTPDAGQHDAAAANHFIHASHVANLAQILGRADIREGAGPEVLEAVLARANAMVAEMLRPVTAPASSRLSPGLAPWQERRVRALVEERLHEGVSVLEMAAAVRLSRSFFSRAFAASFGCAPHAYVVARRVARAKVMMCETGEPLAQIAIACGLSDQAHLSRQFRRHEACTPSAWRRRMRAGDAPGESSPSQHHA